MTADPPATLLHGFHPEDRAAENGHGFAARPFGSGFVQGQLGAAGEDAGDFHAKDGARGGHNRSGHYRPAPALSWREKARQHETQHSRRPPHRRLTPPPCGSGLRDLIERVISDVVQQRLAGAVADAGEVEFVDVAAHQLIDDKAHGETVGAHGGGGDMVVG